MIASRKRLKRSLKLESSEVEMISYLLSIRQGREKERFPTIRLTVMEEHHS